MYKDGHCPCFLTLLSLQNLPSGNFGLTKFYACLTAASSNDDFLLSGGGILDDAAFGMVPLPRTLWVFNGASGVFVSPLTRCNVVDVGAVAKRPKVEYVSAGELNYTRPVTAFLSWRIWQDLVGD